MASDKEIAVQINHFAHALETGSFYQWLKFVCLFLGIYTAWQIFNEIEDFPAIIRILLAVIPVLIFLILIDSLPSLISKVAGSNKTLAVVSESVLTLFLEDQVELPLKDLERIDFGSESYWKRWEIPFLKNRIKAQYSDREIIIRTSVDYAPLYKFINELNHRLPGE